MLVAKELRLAEHFSQAPLTHPTLLKSALFTVVLALVAMMRYLKRLTDRGALVLLMWPIGLFSG